MVSFFSLRYTYTYVNYKKIKKKFVCVFELNVNCTLQCPNLRFFHERYQCKSVIFASFTHFYTILQNKMFHNGVFLLHFLLLKNICESLDKGTVS